MILNLDQGIWMTPKPALLASTSHRGEDLRQGWADFSRIRATSNFFKVVTLKYLGVLPVDRDRRYAHLGFKASTNLTCISHSVQRVLSSIPTSHEDLKLRLDNAGYAFVTMTIRLPRAHDLMIKNEGYINAAL
ncbi:hypothetical protein TNCV_916081 [Trichonephila clavipes]|nr:hypothetical protein TNCV_916081 [Trichonephila clavipes]